MKKIYFVSFMAMILAAVFVVPTFASQVTPVANNSIAIGGVSPSYQVLMPQNIKDFLQGQGISATLIDQSVTSWANAAQLQQQINSLNATEVTFAQQLNTLIESDLQLARSMVNGPAYLRLGMKMWMVYK